MLAVYLGVLDDREDRLLFEQVYRAYRQPMYYIAKSILTEEMDAEDAVHEVFMNIAARYMHVLRRIDRETDMKNYLLKAVKNTALNLREKKKRETEYNDGVIDKSDLSDDAFLDAVCARRDSEMVLEAIRGLDRKYSEVLYAHFVLELTAREAAAMLGRDVSTVKKQLVRGKRLLLERLNGEVSYNDEG